MGPKVAGLVIENQSSIGKKNKKIKCRTCEQAFNIKPALMKHRKQEHNEKVESCFKEAS